MHSVKVNLKENGAILFASLVCRILLTEPQKCFLSTRTELRGKNGECVENLGLGVAGLHTEWGEQQ